MLNLEREISRRTLLRWATLTALAAALDRTGCSSQSILKKQVVELIWTREALGELKAVFPGVEGKDQSKLSFLSVCYGALPDKTRDVIRSPEFNTPEKHTFAMGQDEREARVALLFDGSGEPRYLFQEREPGRPEYLGVGTYEVRSLGKKGGVESDKGSINGVTLDEAGKAWLVAKEGLVDPDSIESSIYFEKEGETEQVAVFYWRFKLDNGKEQAFVGFFNFDSGERADFISDVRAWERGRGDGIR